MSEYPSIDRGMKRIILVNQVTGPIFIDIANYFIQLGYEVQLLTGQIEKTGNSIHQDVRLFKSSKYKRNNPLTRMITWVGFTIQAWLFLRKEKQEAEVMLVSNPPFVPLLSHYLRKKRNLKFRTLIYDIYPDVLEQSGFLSKKLFLSRWWRKVNMKAFSRSERLYTISDGMRSVLSQYAPAQRWEVIYPWVDNAFIKPLSKEENWFVEKYHLQDKIVIEYSGNMGVTHDLMTIVRVAEKLKDNQKIQFVFIGDGAEKQRLIEYSIKRNLQNILFLPFQDPDVLPYSISAADMGIVTLTGVASQLSVPSKTFYQMAAGNAILCIANSDSELARMIVEFDCGKVFPPGSIDDLVLYLSTIKREEIVLLGNNSRTASHHYTIENVKFFI